MAENDFSVKINRGKEFLTDGHKLRIAVKFVGRQLGHKEFGDKIMQRAFALLSDISPSISSPNGSAANILLLYRPSKMPKLKTKNLFPAASGYSRGKVLHRSSFRGHLRSHKKRHSAPPLQESQVTSRSPRPQNQVNFRQIICALNHPRRQRHNKVLHLAKGCRMTKNRLYKVARGSHHPRRSIRFRAGRRTPPRSALHLDHPPQVALPLFRINLLQIPCLNWPKPAWTAKFWPTWLSANPRTFKQIG